MNQKDFKTPVCLAKPGHGLDMTGILVWLDWGVYAQQGSKIVSSRVEIGRKYENIFLEK